METRGGEKGQFEQPFSQHFTTLYELPERSAFIITYYDGETLKTDDFFDFQER